MSEQMTTQEAAERIFSITDYVHHSDWFDVEDEKALDMAWEALLDATPHVLTLAEAQAMEPHTAIWAEFRPEGIVNGPHEIGMINISDSWWGHEYNKTVRWWTGWPDEELRKATPWKEDC